jgi:trans-2,3-dihydro-3-hydroxyanthranilate isomerase
MAGTRAWRYVIADVFTDTPLEGNALAVFTAAEGLAAVQMQRLARETNLSETVFVLPPEAGGDARIRIFTPASEVRFAGHPVLGTAVVLAGDPPRDRVVLETGAGAVPVELARRPGGPVFGWMSQPLPGCEPYPDETALLAALGVERSMLPVELYDNGLRHAFVRLGSEDEVAALRPDLNALAALPPAGVSCFAGTGERWKTRMFAPGLGVAEDPATGSAAGPLAVHLLRHGQIEAGREIVIRQGAEIGRPSTLHARLTGSAERVERVEVGGGAVVVASGEFRIPSEPDDDSDDRR